MPGMMRFGTFAGVSMALVLSVLFSGCGVIMIGPPAEKMDVESGSNEQKNLEAIRAMQADQTGRPASGFSAGQESPPCVPDGGAKNRCANR
ncbi:MAG TPA: hypothetical protein PKA61_02485 [Nitrospira sp.]|nr:hypothetical protein [Nitrospira sp.]